MLILDNHSSHISLQVVELCKNSGITLFTLAPHTSHKLQLLNRSVFAPFKTYYHRTLDDRGRAVSICEIAQLASTAFGLSMTPVNIQSMPQSSGIYSFKRDIFPDDEFQPPQVTNETLTEQNTSAAMGPISSTAISAVNSAFSTPSISVSNSITSKSSTSSTSDPITVTVQRTKRAILVTPEQILPLPTATARKTSNQRKVKCTILTDTPEKKELEQATK